MPGEPHRCHDDCWTRSDAGTEQVAQWLRELTTLAQILRTPIDGRRRGSVLRGGPTLAATRAVEQSSSPKVLVVYFSRTGTTRAVAEAIARATGADLEELREPRSRLGLWGWLRSGYEGTYRRAAVPLPLVHQPRNYDLVFVGSPTWNHALSSPVRGFLESYGKALTRVALFATCAGQGADAVLRDMAALLGGAPLAQLAMIESDVRRGPAVEVGELVERALLALERLAP